MTPRPPFCDGDTCEGGDHDPGCGWLWVHAPEQVDEQAFADRWGPIPEGVS